MEQVKTRFVEPHQQLSFSDFSWTDLNEAGAREESEGVTFSIERMEVELEGGHITRVILDHIQKSK